MDVQTHLIMLGQSEAEQLAQYLYTLPPDGWGQPSACAEWTVGDVVAHLIMVAEMFRHTISHGLQGDLSPPAGFPAASGETAARNELFAQRAIALRKSLGDQLLPTFSTRFDALHQLLTSLGPQDWEKPCYNMLGTLPVRAFLTAQVTELALHGWDIRSRFDPSAHLSADSLAVFMRIIPGFVIFVIFFCILPVTK